MYQLALTYRYLFSKVMPLLAAVGVALCTLMVLVTWSVMSGFLGMLINTGRTLVGDVSVGWPGAGFAYYDELIVDLEKDPLVEAACPMIETFGSITPPDARPRGVLIRGVEGASYARVTQFADTLWWKPVDEPLPKDKARMDPRLDGLGKAAWSEIYKNGLSLTRPDPRTGAAMPAIVPGIHVTGLNRRYIEGYYKPLLIERRQSTGKSEWIDAFLPLDPDLPVVVTVFPIDSMGRPYEAYSRNLPVANEFQSGVYEFDQSIVLMNIDSLQEMLKMKEGLRVVDAPAAPSAQPHGESFAGAPPPATVRDPARVTNVLVKGRGDMSDPARARALRERVQEIYDRFAARHNGEVPSAADIEFVTWEEQNATFINAVRTERTLLLVLFMIISFTAVLLVLAIFWAMVREKTQDIGVLRSLGAGRGGVAWLWVCYGLAIGLVGSTVGLIGSYLIITNINPIHDWLGKQLGLVIWDPKVYYFTVIPNRVEPLDAGVVFVCGILACGLGAFIPALRAAWMNPVAALRNE
ncbi:Lipoprotein-releasing system transmembrane protein LolE [Phycisphaerales bacterium]|nr:Lipoprotein-releasing system transmembrane protein LolE [Phycisphaerales bacterium]